MHSQLWQKIILSILILAIVAGTAGCQATGKMSKGFQDFKQQLAELPHRAGQAVANMLSSIASAGSALVESIKNVVGSIFGGR